MPKTPASCLSLLLEDRDMVNGEAKARLSFDLGDHTNSNLTASHITTSTSPQCKRSFSGSPDQTENSNKITFQEIIKDAERRVVPDSDDICCCNHHIPVVEDSEGERDSESHIKDIGAHLTVTDDESDAVDIEKEIPPPRQAGHIRDWLSARIKSGFPRTVVEPYIREMSYYEEEGDFPDGAVRIFDPYYYSPVDELVGVDGRVNKRGEPEGRALVTLRNGDDLFGVWKNGVRECCNGNVTGDFMHSHGIIMLQGPYTNGVLHGFGHGRLANGLIFQGLFNNGFLEGPVVQTADKSFEYLEERARRDKFGNCDTGQPAVQGELDLPQCFIGVYSRGLPTGYCWQQMEGGGWLHGKVDHEGKFTGDDVMFLFPDFHTCYTGVFQDGEMVSARVSYITSITTVENIMVAIPSTAKFSTAILRHSPATMEGMTVPPLVADHYERERGQVLNSGIAEAGDGLFARRDIAVGEVVSFYHGVYYPKGTRNPNTNYNYQIYLDWSRAPNSSSLDIPTECADTINYTASLGHKVNHSFEPNCEYIPFYHPTFGSQVLAISTIRAVARGEEFTCNYRYDINDAPDWFVAFCLTCQRGEELETKEEKDLPNWALKLRLATRLGHQDPGEQ